MYIGSASTNGSHRVTRHHMYRPPLNRIHPRLYRSCRATSTEPSHDRRLEVKVDYLSSPFQINMDLFTSLSALLSMSFFISSGNYLLDPISSTLYGGRIMVKVVNNLLTCRGNAGCIVARIPFTGDPRVHAEGGVGGAASEESLDISLAVPQSGNVTKSSEVLGIGTVHMVTLNGEMAMAMQAIPRACYALIANMAVHPGARGKGIGRAILRSCEQKAVETFRPKPHALLMLVYRSNYHAVSLYRSEGFKECKEWVDPEWLEDAEKGRLGEERRMLFYKELNQSRGTSKKSAF